MRIFWSGHLGDAAAFTGWMERQITDLTDPRVDIPLELENYERAYRMTEGTQHPSAEAYRANYQRLSREVAARR